MSMWLSEPSRIQLVLLQPSRWRPSRRLRLIRIRVGRDHVAKDGAEEGRGENTRVVSPHSIDVDRGIEHSVDIAGDVWQECTRWLLAGKQNVLPTCAVRELAQEPSDM